MAWAETGRQTPWHAETKTTPSPASSRMGRRTPDPAVVREASGGRSPRRVTRPPRSRCSPTATGSSHSSSAGPSSSVSIPKTRRDQRRSSAARSSVSVHIRSGATCIPPSPRTTTGATIEEGRVLTTSGSCASPRTGPARPDRLQECRFRLCAESSESERYERAGRLWPHSALPARRSRSRCCRQVVRTVRPRRGVVPHQYCIAESALGVITGEVGDGKSCRPRAVAGLDRTRYTRRLTSPTPREAAATVRAITTALGDAQVPQQRRSRRCEPAVCRIVGVVQRRLVPPDGGVSPDVRCDRWFCGFLSIQVHRATGWGLIWKQRRKIAELVRTLSSKNLRHSRLRGARARRGVSWRNSQMCSRSIS